MCCCVAQLFVPRPDAMYFEVSFFFCDSYEQCRCVCVCACHPEHKLNDSIPCFLRISKAHAQHIKQWYSSSSSGTTSSSKFT